MTDQPLSESKMATTGQSTTGMKRTTVLNNRFSHLVFLFGVLLITLLTSGKAMADPTYNVTLANAGGCGLTVSPGTTDGTVKVFTLSVTDATTNKLPAIDDITVTISGQSPLVANDGTDGFTYSNGTITIGSGVTIDADIEITAAAVEKSTDATLSSLTYTCSALSKENVPIKLIEGQYEYIVDLEAFLANTSAITLTAVAKAQSEGATVAVTGLDPYSGLTGDATVTVTAESRATQNYTITFTSKDKLVSITPPTVSQLGDHYGAAGDVVTYLNNNIQTATVTGEKGSNVSLPITWSFESSDNGGEYNPKAGVTNKFRCTLTNLGDLVNPDNVDDFVTVDVKNVAPSTSTLLTSLTYAVADDEPANVTGDLSRTEDGDVEYNVSLPYGTAADAKVTVALTNDVFATAKVGSDSEATSFEVQLSQGTGTIKLTLTAEDGTTTHTVTINFTITGELVTAVENVPETCTLPKIAADKDAAIALLDAMDMASVTLTANSGAELKLKWSIQSYNAGSAAENTFTWTVVKADGSEIAAAEGVTATGTTTVTNYTLKTDAGISALAYQVEGGQEVTINDIKEIGAGTNNVTVAYGTKKATVLVTPADANASVAKTTAPNLAPVSEIPAPTPVSFEVPINGTTVFNFTITAEDGTTKKYFSITFTEDVEKATEVTVATTYQLPKAVDKEADAIALLNSSMTDFKIVTNGATSTKLDWSYDEGDNKGAAYSNEGGKPHVFTWKVQTGEGVDLAGVSPDVLVTGKTTVTNFMPAETGKKDELEITAEKPVDKIGNGTEETVINNVTVSAASDELTIDNATVSTALTLSESVTEIILNKATIKEVVLAANKTTTLSLQSSENKIEKITNNGTLRLKNAEPEVQALSLAIETKAVTLTNDGAVSEVVNNGKFTDETAKIVAVTGAADLSVTTLPKSQSTTGSEVTLTVAATSDNGDVTYQWQKLANSWEDVAGVTTENLTINKEANGKTQYRCEVKSTKEGAITTLYTPSVTVTFKTESTGGGGDNTPSTPTYTVKLPKVTGATFSKGETTTVNEGDNFSFTITLDKDYDQSKPVVTVGGKAIEANADGSYTIKDIQKDTEIVVSGIVKNTATGVEEIIDNAVRVWSEGSTLHITTPEAADAYIVNAAGSQINKVRVAGDYSTQLRAGFYIVRIGTYTAKVIIR